MNTREQERLRVRKDMQLSSVHEWVSQVTREVMFRSAMPKCALQKQCIRDEILRELNSIYAQAKQIDAYMCLFATHKLQPVAFLSVWLVTMPWLQSCAWSPWPQVPRHTYVSVRNRATDPTYAASKIDLKRKIEYLFDILDIYWTIRIYWIYWLYIKYIGYIGCIVNTRNKTYLL